MVERSPVKRSVRGSSPRGGADCTKFVFSTEWYNEFMKCPKCGSEMILKGKDNSYNFQEKAKKRYNRSVYWCKKDDVWVNVETPSNTKQS